MGAWAEHEFGVKTLPPRAYLFAGTSGAAKIDAVVGTFGRVLFHRHDVYDRYLVSGGNAAVMFQLGHVVADVVEKFKRLTREIPGKDIPDPRADRLAIGHGEVGRSLHRAQVSPSLLRPDRGTRQLPVRQFDAVTVPSRRGASGAATRSRVERIPRRRALPVVS